MNFYISAGECQTLNLHCYISLYGTCPLVCGYFGPILALVDNAIHYVPPKQILNFCSYSELIFTRG